MLISTVPINFQLLSAFENDISILLEANTNVLPDTNVYIIFRYFSSTSDVLTSVKKMEESLKRLKKGRGTDKSSGSHGFTDDDKIRQQVVLDIENYGQQVRPSIF